jgi:peptide/nickel transport system substrate-binding protein
VSRRFAPLFALLLLFCFGCDRGETPVPGTPAKPRPAVDDGRPQDGGTLVRRMESEVSTINPIAATTQYDRYVGDYLFTPLLYLDQDLQPIPGLADSWDVEEDGRLYRFRLNDKATFSDGVPVKASDVLFTLRKIVDPASEAVQVAAVFEYLDMTRTRATDDHTIEIAFRQPLAAQLIRFNDLLIVPEHVYSKGNFRNDYNQTAVGSGPYKLVRFEPGKEIVLERRSDYWSQRPPLQTIVFKIILDQSTAWNALKRGDIDETRISSDLWERERQNPELAKTIDFKRFYTLSYNFITWNTRNPRLSDKRVRRALAMAIPIDTVIRTLYYNTARPMSGPFIPEDFAYNPTVPVIRHDPDGAKALLKSAGWVDTNGDGVLDKGGKPLRIELVTMAGAAATAQFTQMIQAEMKKIGVDLHLNVMEASAAIQRILGGQYEAAYFGMDLDNDPDPFNVLHSSQFPQRGQNYAFFSNTQVDRMLEEARTELDRSKRKDLYWKLHEIVAAEQPYTWTMQVSSKWGIRRNVRGVELSRGFGLYRWYPGPFAWWIPRDQRTHDRPAQ